MAFLDIRMLRKTYGSAVALDGVDLTVQAGEFVTLLGPSGSGKTTLLMSIAGFTRPDEGGIVVDGQDVTFMDPEDRDFGLVFQGYALFPHLSVAENIAFPLKVRKWDKAHIAAKVEEMLRLVDLTDYASRKPKQLSGGQQQRVAIARALAYGPRILLLDEPLSALDRNLRESMQRELKRLHQETGVTFIFVTHDQEEAYAMSDRIAVFHGRLILNLGAPSEIYSNPQSLFVAGFLGGNNIFKARHASADGTLTFFGNMCSRPPRFNPAVHGKEGEVIGWVRPEDIAVGDTDAAATIRFDATVVDISFVGSAEKLTVTTTDGQELTLQVPMHSAVDIRPGAVLRCAVKPEAIGFLPPDI